MPDHSAPRADNLSVDKYNSEKLLQPKSRKIKEKYFEIYENYVVGGFTERQLSKMFNLSLDHVSRIIKWVVFETDKGDLDVYLKTMIDRLSYQLQELSADIAQSQTIKEKTYVRGEYRRTLKLLAQIQRVLTNDVNIDLSDRRQINMNTPNVGRRTGAKAIETDI